ncbi:hypothetical protein HF086_012040 [Spodoptera exigua]|uniref:REPAT22 n=1 Tax=Spodoptera exigua TaxID=7107 RepID=I0B5U2_SPOEX|nr:REPAT22 [Spodoptera exigua]KAH9637427.1 hypothetical protein HF086_012040 [Spodoptera exigua]
MKNIIIIIAVLAALADCAVINNELITTRGTARPGAVIFFDESYYVPAVPDTIQRLDVVYRGNSTTYISQVRIEEPRPNVNFNFSPLGNTYMQVRLASAVGMPIQVRIQFLGHYTDWP